jgi:hypothetical protein
MRSYGRALEKEAKQRMSMRQHVGQQEIEQFLVQVGRTRQPARLYLVGGAAMVHRGIRPGQTLDIDIQITVDPANLTAQIAQLKQRLNMNIEFASPADFMPLPTQWETRSQFIKRYGQVDAFYFDWYSIALSKMQRANRQDVVDVQLLVRQGFVDGTELDRLYQDVLGKIGRPPYDRLLPNLSQNQCFLQNQIQFFHVAVETAPTLVRAEATPVGSVRFRCRTRDAVAVPGIFLFSFKMLLSSTMVLYVCVA